MKLQACGLTIRCLFKIFIFGPSSRIFSPDPTNWGRALEGVFTSEYLMDSHIFSPDPTGDPNYQVFVYAVLLYALGTNTYVVGLFTSEYLMGLQ